MKKVLRPITGLTLLAVVLALLPAVQAPAAAVTPDRVAWVRSDGLWHIPRPGLPDYTFQISWSDEERFVEWFLADWDGDEFDTPGVSFASGSSFDFYWTDTLPADGSVASLRSALDQHVSGQNIWERFADNFFGDWDGDGIDTLGRDSTRGNVLLTNSWPDASSSAPDSSFWFGRGSALVPGVPLLCVRCYSEDISIHGDWDGNGTDTMAVYRVAESKVYYSNTNPTVWGAVAPTDGQFWFGALGDVPLVGDWNGDGLDTVGVYRIYDQTVYFRNSLTTGFGSTVPRWTPPPGGWGLPFLGRFELP